MHLHHRMSSCDILHRITFGGSDCHSSYEWESCLESSTVSAYSFCFPLFPPCSSL
jgi:hypothetical protein